MKFDLLKNQRVLTYYIFLMFGVVASSVFTQADKVDEYTPVYQQFIQAKKTGTEPILADFSYAGYKRGEAPIPDVKGPVFDVTDYGAVPDDDQSDQTAIRAAIGAAQDNGGGVVFFPPGQFLVNTDEDDGENIVISESNIVMRGSGYAKGGTVIKMVNSFPPTFPDKMYSTPFMFIVKPEQGLDNNWNLAKVTEDTRRETFEVTVDDASKIKPGDWVTLSLESREAVESFLAPYPPHPKFKRIYDKGMRLNERHSVASVDGNTIRFNEPTHMNIEAKYGWTIKGYPHVEETGFEDICFMGGWEQDFIHHRSALDDGGWSMVRIEQAVNSWVRRCAFVNINYGLTVRFSAYYSVLNTIYAGNPAHYSMHTREGYGVLGAFLIDAAGHHHGPSVGYRASGTVYCHAKMQPNKSIDSHSDQPIATLLDNMKGGVLYGSGGPMSGMPHHLRHFTLWNFKHDGDRFDHYDFWHEGDKECFVLPVIVGMHGDEVTFNEDSLEVLESLGQRVKPDSLYEAQLELRLGKLPNWYLKAKAEDVIMRNAELPPHKLVDN